MVARMVARLIVLSMLTQEGLNIACCTLKQELPFLPACKLVSNSCCFLTQKVAPGQTHSYSSNVLPCTRIWKPSWVVHVWLPAASFFSPADYGAIEDGSIQSAERFSHSVTAIALVGGVTSAPFLKTGGARDEFTSSRRPS